MMAAAPSAATLGGRALDSLLALAACGLGGFLAWHYPLAPFAATGLFALAGVAAFRRPAWLPLLVPALLPVIGLAPWSGWLSFEEIDLLVLALAGGAYANRALLGHRRPASGRRGAWTLAALLALSLLISMQRGFDDAGGFVFGWTQGYDDPMNSVRIGKSFFLALLLTPLLRWQLRDPARQAGRKLAWGLAIGLGGAALAVLWERLAFTDLLNFSSDYRTTALFWEMHVGGAALDGWLLLTMPFALWVQRHARTPGQHALALGLIAIAVYAALTTFSRGVYLALLVTLPLLAWQTRPRRGGAKHPGQALWPPQRWAAALLTLAAMAALVFTGGGYRALAALLGVIAVALATPRVLRGIAAIQMIAGILLGLMLGGALALLADFLPKGPYLLHFALAALLIAALWLLPGLFRGTQRIFAVAGLLAASVTAANVAAHWGGDDALWGMLAALAPLLAVACWAAFAARPLWPDAPRWQAAFLCAAVAASAVVAVFIGGAYMGGRFSTSLADLEARQDHWSLSASLLQTPQDRWLGKGLGRYPANYFFAIPDGKFPGTYRIAEEDGNAWLVITGARHPMSFGDIFRVSQRLPFDARGPFIVALKFRALTDVTLHVEVCEKHLLYVGGCVIGNTNAKRGDDWQSATIRLTGARLGGGPWYAPRMRMFSIGVANESGAADIGEIVLIGPDGRRPLANGGFAEGMAHWFFSSDHDHLPWHAKNIIINILFDQGYFGLAAFLALTAAALWRLNLGRAREHELAPYLSAAIIGFLVVGIFDSLLDVPRLAMMFYILVLAAWGLSGSSQPLSRRSDAGPRPATPSP